MNIKRILCPIDFSDASTHAIDHAVAFANWCGARITALHVCRPPLLSDPGAEMSSHGQLVDDIDTENLRTQTAAFCKAATTAGINLEILIGHGEPTGRILEHATGLPADLIVIGTHGTSGFQHLLLGSVTERGPSEGQLRGAHCASACASDITPAVPATPLCGRLFGLLTDRSPVRLLAGTGVGCRADDPACGRVAMAGTPGSFDE